MESLHQDAVLLIERRILFFELRLNRFHFGLCLHRLYAVSQPAEYKHLVFFAIQLGAIESERHPHVKLPAGSKKTEVPGKHSNDGVRLVVERDAAAQDAWVASIAPLPQRVTEHHHSLVARRFLLGKEIAPKYRLHSK